MFSEFNNVFGRRSLPDSKAPSNLSLLCDGVCFTFIFHQSLKDQGSDLNPELDGKEKLKDTGYLVTSTPDYGCYPAVTITVAKSIMRLFEKFTEKKWLHGVIEEELGAKEHEIYLSMIADLELCGHIIQLPGSVKVEEEGLLVLDFLSEGSKKAIKRVKFQKGRNGQFIWFMICYRKYNSKKRDFV